MGRGPTHAGDRDPASLHARQGFERIGFELAEAARMLAGPGEDEEVTGEQADIVDVTLVTQHANASDVTTVSVPYGDILLAAENREVRDQATGLTTTLPANFLSGFTVAGPGSLVVTAGLRGEAGGETGVGGRIALSDVAIGDASARGIETIGNLVNSALPAGGAAIRIATAGDVELNDRGSIDTLQGGNIDILSTRRLAGRRRARSELHREARDLHALRAGRRSARLGLGRREHLRRRRGELRHREERHGDALGWRHPALRARTAR